MLLGSAAGIEDALRAVTAIAGNASVFDDPDRIAMPDETLRFGTGTDRDKDLLLHVRLERPVAGKRAGRRPMGAFVHRNRQLCARRQLLHQYDADGPGAGRARHDPAPHRRLACATTRGAGGTIRPGPAP
ncbi:MAG TPA: hypothetical protein VGF07_06425 [Stellaceae bacterium]|jgi:hypothetical protein